MWKITRIFLLISVLAFSLFSTTNFVVAQEGTQLSINQNLNLKFVKVKFDNKVLFHEQVPQKMIVQVFNQFGEVVESEVVTQDMELELEAPRLEKGQLLSYWSFTSNGEKLYIEPVLISESDITVKFVTTDGGYLLVNNAQINEVVKSVTKGAKLKDILPNVNPKNRHKFLGWYEVVIAEGKVVSEKPVTNLEDRKITDNKFEYYAKFYPDFNENNIDDRTEKVTIKFVTNSHHQFKDIQPNVGTPFTLPQLEKKGHVFLGWYKDEEFKEKFVDDVFTESLTLYGKWEKAEKVIKEAEKNPITDRDVSDQIERMLNERLRNVNNTPQQPVYESNKDNEVLPQPAIGSTFKETKYVFNNKNLGQKYIVKFFDETERYLFSLVLPYGKTIKLYDEKNRLRDEYAIRQDTTIKVNSKDYVNEDSELIGFDTRNVTVNSSQITEVFPKVKANTYNEQLEYEQALKAEQEKADKKMNLIVITLVIGIVILVFSIIGAYLFIRRKKMLLEDPIIEEQVNEENKYD